MCRKAQISSPLAMGHQSSGRCRGDFSFLFRDVFFALIQVRFLFMRRNAQLKIALDLSMGRERFNCQENCKVAGRGVMPRGQPPAEYGCRSKAAAPTKTTALWMVCCAALAGAGCQRRCKPHIRSGTRRQTASGCKCFPKR